MKSVGAITMKIARIDKLIDRTVMLQRFVGMAQQRVLPSLETINEARVLLGMHELTEMPPIGIQQ